MDWTGIAALATAVGLAPLLMAFSNYKIKQLEKRAAAEISRKNEADKANRATVNANIGRIYGELHRMLNNLHVDRVYIAQPHPLISQKFMTISMEVTQPGVSKMQPYVRSLPLGDIPLFVRDISTKDYILYENISAIEDGRASALMSLAGTSKVAIRRMVGLNGDWIGSIFVEVAGDDNFDMKDVEIHVRAGANLIQHILPPYGE